MVVRSVLGIGGLLLVSVAAAQSLAGLWDASVKVNGIEIPFQMEFSGEVSRVEGAFVNGDEKVISTAGRFEKGALVLNFDQYASKLEATWKDGKLEGTYGRVNRLYPLQAVRAGAEAPSDGKAPSIAGLWEIGVHSPKGESAWHFVVRQSGGEVSAAILRVDGDTGTLRGRYANGKFVLSHFSGARPMLLEVTPAEDGTLSLLQNGKQTYTAVRAPEARAKGLPEPTDPTAHTTVKDPAEPFHFRFADLAGQTVSDSDARFRGKVVIVAIGGSWCPNCHDEAPFLEELYRKYHSRGLEIVGLFFEEADQLKDPTRVRAFIRQYGIEYPMLLAGETGELNAKLPQAVNRNASPTTFDRRRDGRVRSVHAGFAGRASGAFHDELKRDVTKLVERLLAEDTVAAR